MNTEESQASLFPFLGAEPRWERSRKLTTPWLPGTPVGYTLTRAVLGGAAGPSGGRLMGV